MRTNGVARVTTGIAITLGLLVAASRPAAAQGRAVSPGAPGVPNLIGDWAGMFQSSLNPNDFGIFDLFIGAQRNRRFTCRLTLQGTPPIPCDGTIAASGEFHVNARRGVFQVNHGMYMELGDRIAIASAEYRFGGDVGSLQLIQKTDQPPDPALFHSFSGEFMSDTTMMSGMVNLSLDPAREGKEGFDGLMMVTETIIPPDPCQDPMTIHFEFDVFVSSFQEPPDPSKMHPFAIVGLSTMGDPGVFVVTGDIGNDGFMASGEYMYYPMGIATMDVVDMGMFDVFMDVGDVIR